MGQGLDRGYGVLKCRAIAKKIETERNSPHYQILVTDNIGQYRLALNVRSTEAPYDLLYAIVPNFQHPITEKLYKLDWGFTNIKKADRKPGGIALDYIRGNLLNVTQMQPLPFQRSGGSEKNPNDLNEFINSYIERAIKTEDAIIYAFGEPWEPDKGEDKIFGFQPSCGVHNLHKNQGSPKPSHKKKKDFSRENGVWQDGGLLIHFPSSAQPWVAMFFKFASQASHTDDINGDALRDPARIRVAARVGNESPVPQQPKLRPRIKIIAALVNPIGDDISKASVTLMNYSPEAVELKGWAIADSLKRKHRLTNLTLNSGETTVVKLTGQEAKLSNKGGLITLLDAQGIKVDGVSYTRAAIVEPGWTITF
ncbi:DUF2278 family protein [Oscillatoria sp. FACHB-1406]|uniref:DUF2278 family protein n=1 Tax=Oscillatoria sp. FACHB-1406 TaxID=2692846 RepID=UPI0016843833|nr:DUF2278 family protein [Oscillatoria sp. FACHB-1406]MBD2579048.1 DUF2278 family protein [Oscillatoria sp. FACHB-1406]